MKKTLSLLLSLALVGSLAACGPKAPEAIPPASLWAASPGPERRPMAPSATPPR